MIILNDSSSINYILKMVKVGIITSMNNSSVIGHTVNNGMYSLCFTFRYFDRSDSCPI